ncbi:MAG: hypothetical protein AB7U98_00025 [Candidatus Nitrosocosmicus sp.]
MIILVYQSDLGIVVIVVQKSKSSTLSCKVNILVSNRGSTNLIGSVYAMSEITGVFRKH